MKNTAKAEFHKTKKTTTTTTTTKTRKERFYIVRTEEVISIEESFIE